jgi:maltooligosyltrehalose trehalohydrolase
LKWDEIHERQHGEMLEWFRRLIHLRRHTPSLNDGDLSHLKVGFEEKKRWLTMERGQVRVLCNLGEEAAEFENAAGFSLVLGSGSDLEVTDDKVVLPPNSLAILSAERA